MSMKKIIASAAAAALTVSSLAVVGVSAEATTKTFNFVGKTGKMKISYTQTASFLGGVEPRDLFTQADPNYTFDYALSLSLADGYKTDNLDAVNGILAKVKKGDGATITITGTNIQNRTITAKATARSSEWGANGEVKWNYEGFRVRENGDGLGLKLESYDLDITDFDTIKSITVSETFSVDTDGYYVPANVGGIVVNNSLGRTIGADLTNYWCSYTSESKENNGRVISVGNAYAFEGGYDEKIVISAAANGVPESHAYGLGFNTLRWVNDNIVQNKGAKLRINFMTPGQLQDAIQGGNISTYPTEIGGAVLNPGSSSTTTANDITIGVNLKNTTKLQQTTNIKDYSAEFDWDTLVQASTATVSGNVDSIAFRIQNTENVRNTIADKDLHVGIRSIEIILPDQSTVAPVEEVIEVEDPVSGVKASGTAATIRGNGGAILQAIGKLTSSNLTYEVKLLDKDSNAVQPAGEVTLTLPIPKDNQGKTIKGGTVAHGLSNGTVENLPIVNIDTYKTDGFVKVVTKSFSPFTITFATFGMNFEDEETTTETEATTTEPVTEEATTTEAPAQTGSTNNGGEDKNVGTGVVLAVVPAAIAAAAVVISKKRK